MKIGNCVSKTAVSALSLSRYHHEMKAARSRLSEGSDIIQTGTGPIEYADIGEGCPVLVIHGAGGGYDQGIILARTFLGDRFRWIVPSRFGYLRTPVPANGSAAAQADAYAGLLEALNIRQAAVMAVSDGGPSALQFALHYPESITSLIMIAAKSHTPPTETFWQKAVFSTIFRSDFLYWSITTCMQSFLLSMFGVSAKVQAGCTREERESVYDFMQSMHPISWRKGGIYNDRATLSGPLLNEYPLDKITAPTLVVHARDDLLQPFSHGEHTAGNIPVARLLEFPSGGHMLAGHAGEVRSESVDFIIRHALSC
ncbi:MAG: alpha/beta hydrolase [Dehalococcoidales bacterium]|nr:alpha/beta hydrolase [Dehalococcoidales bacterium]